MTTPAPIFASEAKAARLLDMKPAEFRAFSNGWTRYRLDQNGNGTKTATETVNCTANSENALDDESEKT